MSTPQDARPRHEANLVDRTSISVAWVFVARIVVRFSDVLLLMVLARVLVPEDFGLVAIATSVVAILDMVTDMPLAAPLIRLEKVTKRFLDTAFTLAILRGLFILGLIGVLAGPIARFYGDPRLQMLLIVLAAGCTLRSLQNPNLARLVKSLQYRQNFVIEVTGKAVGVIAAIVFGLLTGSYWALVVSTVVNRIAGVAVSYLFVTYRPAFSFSEVRYFWEFLGWLFPSQILTAIALQFDRLFLGHFVPGATMGFYSVSNSLTTIVEQSVRTAVSGPLMSSFVIAQSEPERLRRGYIVADSAILMIGLPTYLITFFFAEPLIVLAFGEKWIQAVPILQGLALAQMPALLRVPFRPLVMAAGRTEYVFLLAISSVGFRVPAIALGWALAGIEGVVAGIGLANLGSAAVAMYFNRRITEIGLLRQLTASWRVCCAAVVTSLLAWGAAMALPDMTGLVDVFLLVAVCLLVVGLYVGVIFGLWRLVGRPLGIETKILGQIMKRLHRAPAQAN